MTSGRKTATGSARSSVGCGTGTSGSGTGVYGGGGDSCRAWPNGKRPSSIFVAFKRPLRKSRWRVPAKDRDHLINMCLALIPLATKRRNKTTKPTRVHKQNIVPFKEAHCRVE